jgi:hypothetical protein
MMRVCIPSIPRGRLAVVAFALCAFACSSGSGAGPTAKTSSKSASKGGGASTASEAVKTGQRLGKNAAANRGKAADKGAAVGGGSKTRRGEASTPAAAQSAGQKFTEQSKIKASLGQAQDKGAAYAQATCDGAFEATGFCADDRQAVVCSGGHWWALDCAALYDGAFCGEDTALHAIDCYAATELEQAGPIVTCDAEVQGTAFCADEATAVFCDAGHWYALACSELLTGSYCENADDIRAVDCVQDGTLIALE